MSASTSLRTRALLNSRPFINARRAWPELAVDSLPQLFLNLVAALVLSLILPRLPGGCPLRRRPRRSECA